MKSKKVVGWVAHDRMRASDVVWTLCCNEEMLRPYFWRCFQERREIAVWDTKDAALRAASALLGERIFARRVVKVTP